jgi:hypothetical protein
VPVSSSDTSHSRRFSCARIMYGQDHLRAALGENAGGDEPDSAVLAGDDGGAAGQVGKVGGRDLDMPRE